MIDDGGWMFNDSKVKLKIKLDTAIVIGYSVIRLKRNGLKMKMKHNYDRNYD